MPHGKVAVVDIVGVNLDPQSHCILALAAYRAVYVGLANVVQQRCDDDTVALQAILQVGTHGDDHLAQFECCMTHVERVLKQASIVIQMVIDTGWSTEEVVAALVQIGQQVVDSITARRTQQLDKFVFSR